MPCLVQRSPSFAADPSVFVRYHRNSCFEQRRRRGVVEYVITRQVVSSDRLLGGDSIGCGLDSDRRGDGLLLEDDAERV